MLKLHSVGGAACQQPPKFELPIAQEGMVYKICDSVYKIVQNKYKIMIYVAGDMHLAKEKVKTGNIKTKKIVCKSWKKFMEVPERLRSCCKKSHFY